MKRFCITALMLLSVACQCGESQPGLLAYIRAQPQWTMQTQRLSHELHELLPVDG